MDHRAIKPQQADTWALDLVVPEGLPEPVPWQIRMVCSRDKVTTR